MNLRYGRRDIIGALCEAGLAKGDVVYFYTSLGMLGIAEGVETQDELNALYLDCFREVLGPSGTILVGTGSSQTFGGTRALSPLVYDPATTPSSFGPFPNFFLRQPGVIRGPDPMASVVGLGPACEALFDEPAPTSNGADSVFERLLSMNAKCCNVGLGPNWTPFIHYVDWLVRVPFRYDKLFHCETVIDGERKPLDWICTVPLLSKIAEANAHRVGRAAEAAGIWHWAPLGRARVYVADYKLYFDFVMEHLKEDPWAQAFGPPRDPVLVEEERIGKRSFEIACAPEAAIQEKWRALLPLPRHTLSDGFSQSLAFLAKDTPLQVRHTLTGTNCFDWVVPEKWRCGHAELRTASGEVILSTAEDPHCVLPYSTAFEGEVDHATLMAHLQRTHGPPLFEENYMLRDWGFMASDLLYSRLKGGKYHVSVRSDFAYGAMEGGDWIAPGSSSETVLICTYLNQGMTGEETVSGVLAALDWMNDRTRSPGRLTYRLLVLASAVGLAAWAAAHREEFSRISCALMVRGLAGDGPLVVQSLRDGDTRLDRAAQQWRGQVDGRVQIEPRGVRFDPYPSGRNPVHADQADWGTVPAVVMARPSTEGTPLMVSQSAPVLPVDRSIVPVREFLETVETGC